MNLLEKLILRFRLLIRENIFLYPIYLKYYRKEQIDELFPSEKTDIHITGYPRSANTFATEFAKLYFSELSIKSHIHSTVSLKKALKYNVDTFVLIRNPIDAISSYVIRSNEQYGNNTNKFLNYAIYDYLYYYNYVLNNINEFIILKFETVIESPSKFLEVISNNFGEINHNEIDQNKVKELYKKVYEDKKKEDSNREKTLSSLPNKKKNKIKDDIKPKIKKHNKYKEIISLYKEIIKNGY